MLVDSATAAVVTDSNISLIDAQEQQSKYERLAASSSSSLPASLSAQQLQFVEETLGGASAGPTDSGKEKERISEFSSPEMLLKNLSSQHFAAGPSLSLSGSLAFASELQVGKTYTEETSGLSKETSVAVNFNRPPGHKKLDAGILANAKNFLVLPHICQERYEPEKSNYEDNFLRDSPPLTPGADAEPVIAIFPAALWES